GPNRLPEQDEREREHEVERVPVQVLEDEREPRLSRVPPVGLGDRARRRRQPEAAVVGLAVVVAGGAEEQREGEDQEGRRHAEPAEGPVAEQWRGDVLAVRGEGRWGEGEEV